MVVSLDDFKSVLRILKEKDIGLKVKTHTGWSSDYLHIIGFIASHTDQSHSAKHIGGVVLSNLSETEGIMINNISTINAFELQHDIDGYKSAVVYHLSDNRSLKALIID